MKEVIENFINIKKELGEINTKLKKRFELMAPVQKWSIALRAYSIYAAAVVLLIHLLFGLGMALAFMLLMCALFVVVSFYISKDIRLYNYMSTQQKERAFFRNSSLFIGAIFLPLAAAFTTSVNAVAIFTTLVIGFSFTFSYISQRRKTIFSRGQNFLTAILGYRTRSTSTESEEKAT